MPTLEDSPTLASSLAAVEQTRTIRAPRAIVYHAWTDPKSLKSWFGPANLHCPVVELDVRVGGAYRIEFHPSPDFVPPPDAPASVMQVSEVAGSYTEVVPNERLQFTWIPNWIDGEKTLVTVTFREMPDGTEIELRHENFLTPESRDGHSKGWSGSLEKLAGQLEAR